MKEPAGKNWQKKISQALKKSQIIYFDTDILIYLFENNPSYSKKIITLLDLIEALNSKIIISGISITELFVAPFKKKDTKTVYKWIAFLKSSPQIKVVEINNQDFLDAAFFRAKYSLKTPDSIHLAKAVNSKADLLISNDKAFQKTKEIQILNLQ
jgi:predicted nucleic acid-binding protein